MLWVYDHYKYFYSYSAVRFWRLKSIPALWGLSDNAYFDLWKSRTDGKEGIYDHIVYTNQTKYNQQVYIRI